MGEQQLAILDQLHEGVVPAADLNQDFIDFNQQRDVMVADEVIADREDVIIEHQADIPAPDGNIRVEVNDHSAEPRAPIIVNRNFRPVEPAPNPQADPVPEESQPDEGVDAPPPIEDDVT